MIEEDPRRTHLPRETARIVALYEATNQPLVQPDGRSAQSARGVVVALERGGAYEAVVAVTLTETGENVIYAGTKVEQHELSHALEDALAFAESMGFILDASGWTNLEENQKIELLERNPAFRQPTEKKALAAVERPKALGDPLAVIARLMAAFCFLLFIGCSGLNAEQRAKAAEVHEELGDNLLVQGDAQQALKEYRESLTYEELPSAHLGIGLIDAWSLGRFEESEKEFKRALEMNPDYSEAMTNLGAVYLQRGRFSEAVPLLAKAAADPLYKTRALAQSNLGWALYKSGQTDRAISEIRGALVVAPKYCVGWRQLGIIYSDVGRLEEAAGAYAKYSEACPDALDAHLSLGKALVRQSKVAEAKAEFQRCVVAKDSRDQPVANECARYLRDLGAP
jgi:type IV pilus assembly protein PilF